MVHVPKRGYVGKSATAVKALALVVEHMSLLKQRAKIDEITSREHGEEARMYQDHSPQGELEQNGLELMVSNPNNPS